VRDCEALLDARKLTPQPAPSRVVALRLHDEGERESSRLLHRLRVRGVPGFVRQSGPQPGVYSADASATGRHQRRGGAAAEHGERGLTERWTVADHADRLAALIEAAAFGAPLEAAATAKLARALAAPDLNSEDAAGVVREAVLAGLLDVVGRALSSLRRIVAGESDLVRLGGALGSLLGLYDSDALFGARRHAELAAAVRELADRGRWLLEQVNGSSSATDGRRSAAVAALRDCARTPGLADDVHAPFVDLCQRRTHDADAPPALRGACLGALWSLNVEGAANNIRVAHAYVSNPYDFDVLFRMRPAGLGAALPLVADVTHRRLVSTGRADAWLTGGPNFQAPSVGSHFAGAGDTFFPNYTPQNAGQVTANRAWAFNTVSANFQVVAAANDSGILTALSTVRSNLNTGTLPSPTLQYFAVNQTTGVIGNANQLTQDADGFVTVPKAATGVGGSRTPTVILAVYFAAPNADSITLNLYPPGDTAADAPLLTNNIRGDAPVPATNRFLVAKTTTQLAFQEVIPLTLLNVSPANGQSLVHTCANRSDAAQCFWVKNFGELRNLKVRVPLRTAGAPTIFGTQATKAGSTVADYAATFPVKAPKSLPDSATTDYSLRESVAP
jgi:hypothetical protein